jgi:K(+)-stimulated pyrophosphate-energized sodium pump
VTGHATNIITSLAVSLQDAGLPATVITASMWIAYFVGDGLYDVALATAVMPTMAAIVVVVDSYGPITDNVGGIVEVSELLYEVRTITDALDAVIGQADVGKQVTDSFVTMA